MLGTVFKLLTYSLLTSVIVLAMVLVMKVFYSVDTFNSHKIRIADVLACFLLVFITSARYEVGSDYFQYLRMSRSYGEFFSSMDKLLDIGIIRDYSYQIGFPLLTVISNNVFHNDYAIFFVVACVIYIPLFIYFRKKSQNVFYSICVYLFFGLWGLSLNIIKQAIAMVFMCFAYEALKKKKFLLFGLLTAGGVLFHSTALLAGIVFLGAFFIKPTLKHLNICVVVGIVLRFTVMIIIRFLARFSLFARYYSRYISENKVTGVDRTVIPVGVFFETVLVIYILLLAIKNEKILAKTMPDIDSYISVVMISVPFSILGLSSTLWLANRFAKYFLQFLTILVPVIMVQGKRLSKENPFVIKVDRSFILLCLLFVWHFFYSSLMLDNNTFVIKSLFFI